MELNIIGNVIGTSGYSCHTKGLVNSLAKLHDLRLTCPIQPGQETQLTDLELQSLKKPDSKERINIIIDMPHNWPVHLNKQQNIGFLVFEGDKIPKSWTENILDERITQVWVPSTHCFKAIENTFNKNEFQMIKNKIKIVPHGFNPEIFYNKDLKNEIFTFLCNKGFRNELDRGGIQHALRAFIQEFKKGEARLILKLNMSYVMSPQNLQLVIDKYAKESGKPKEEIPEISAIYDNLTPNQLNDLYNSSDILLNPTEAEAFSLPCIESMATGKPVISTNFGGQTDYITNENGYLVEGELHEIYHEVLYEGVKWMTPNLENLKRCMRMALNEPDELKNKGLKCLETSKSWTWENSAQKATEHLNYIIKG